MGKYRFDEKQYFVIENFDQAKTFSSFLPGLAGLYGIPMWAFYVNRGQAMVSFGVQDKNHAITEFFPANQAYQRVSMNGFRTFIKLDGKIVFEPFSSYGRKKDRTRNMYIKENELKIEEINHQYGVKSLITYFTLPNENFGSLVRKVEIENLSERSFELEVLDGLPAIIPYGIDDAAYKAVGNTLKSWMDVFNLENGIPYYRVRSSTNDSAEVEEISKGHFYLSFDDHGQLITPVVDAELVFGSNSSFSFPDEFESKSLHELSKAQPVTSNKVPCGFSGLRRVLGKGEQVTFHTLVGHVKDIEIINEKAADIRTAGYMDRKYEEAQNLVTEITKDVETKTASPLFDAYVNQSYLDNVLRGGFPIELETDDSAFTYYVFSRKHGDLERDYNFFSLAPEYFSQGNGNFRDVNQNRRNDVFFHPETGDYNIKLFMSLIQADGYNPLVVKGASFELKDQSDWGWLDELVPLQKDAEFIKKKLIGTYTPGYLLQTISDSDIQLNSSLPNFLEKVLSKSSQNIEAEFGEGYWMDHWTYNLDLVENYLKVYPENKAQLLFDDYGYKYFHSPVFVNPRSEKYVLANGKVRQYEAITEFGHQQGSNWVMRPDGEFFTSNLYSKLFSLALLKFSTLDPFGMGVEMEANKPGWNDSMNGLPGIFGSAMSETLELKRLLEFLISSGEAAELEIALPAEIAVLADSVVEFLNQFENGELDNYSYWNQTAAAREKYRELVKNGFEGTEKNIELQKLTAYVKKMLHKTKAGIDKATELGNGLLPTYFSFEAVNWEKIVDENGNEKLNKKGLPLVKVNSFEVSVLPHFLEGPARALKTADLQTARSTYQHVRNSEIYDSKLKMYKTSGSLEDQTFDIGRARAFTPGWLERESIFMHMEFKYLLSVLKSRLYEEFYEDIIYAMPPFMDAEVYGRSVLENSSFIASSVNPDSSLHGQGFVARLSGTTAEFLSIWQLMMMGKNLFDVNEKGLTLQLEPILPSWLFDSEGKVQFTLLGKIQVTYHNPSRRNTFGDEGAKTVKYVLQMNGEEVEVNGDKLQDAYAQAVRDGKVSRMDVYLD
ncbi:MULTISPECIES: cellobiose phosphorylase [unclassified Mesobacillus]|uniref:cellobiose phosphorylase n=1 Tax=unclassified Mesobacillus TaxID=2675270 RepID=UPI0020414458|nr:MULTISPECIES: cellobiose phosphorylase [unclassified Mesobacillus]MCM3125022.1 cellobiose phosphorylase [Mesobacillus sp. MER 33]MCM3235218.1 cellobiose phosphorylase [Mesobacillus sp. MER 48]